VPHWLLNTAQSQRCFRKESLFFFDTGRCNNV
jgi:hypothetical protein